MNDQSLRNHLEKLAVPPADAAAREKALHRAEIAFANRPTAPAPSHPTEIVWWRRTALLALLCAAVTFICVSWWHHARSTEGELPDANLLTEMESLFPGQLDGVITSGTDVSLDLAPVTTVVGKPPSQPLSLTLRRGKQIVRVLAYSGRQVCVTLGGERQCFEPLLTADGKVIVEGDKFLWSNANPMPVAGYRMEARAL